jgi:hypothetical protein
MTSPFEGMQRVIQTEQAMQQARRIQANRESKRYAAQIALPHLLSGEAMFIAMKRAVDDLVGRAPQDHDVLIQIGDLSVIEARFIEPHTFFLRASIRTGIAPG